MNPSKVKEFIEEEVGSYEDVSSHLYSLFLHLGYGDFDNSIESISWSIRPSIILRSECEFHGVSSPRFTLRGTLPNGSFISLRRLKTLALNIDDWAPKPPVHSLEYAYVDPGDIGDLKARKLKQVISSNVSRCIADSFFLLPDRMKKVFSVVDDLEVMSLRFTRFVRPH